MTAAPPNNTAAPSISGTTTDGQTLTAASGSWTGSPSYAYQWRSCDSSGANCSDVQGATGTTYTLGAGDIGTTLRVVVTATNSGGSVSVTSQPTDVIGTAVPANITVPSISGTAADGETLTASRGTWSGTSPA